MSTVLTEKARYAGDFIMSEGPYHQSRDAVTIVSGAGKLVAGTVIGKITASGKWKTSTLAAVDGSQNPAGIVIYDVDATSADAQVAAIVRLAEVNKNNLVYGADIDNPTKVATANAALKALTIIPR